MDETECLERYGLFPAGSELVQIRALLAAEVEKEAESQGHGDTLLIKLCCVQLFSAGSPEDSLLIWGAKRASMDAGGAVDVQLLCGAGVPATKQFLRSNGSEAAMRALTYIEECEDAGDFDSFSPADHMEFYSAYYRIND